MTVEAHLREAIAQAETAEIGPAATAKRFLMAPAAALNALRDSDGRFRFSWDLALFIFILVALGWTILHPFQKFLGTWAGIASSPVVLLAMGFLGFVWMLSLGSVFDDGRKIREALIRTYRQKGFDFSAKEFADAAAALEAMVPISSARGQEKYGQRIMDVLILSGSVDEMDGKWRRIVSIRSIREDRAADERDDEE
jgi:hypothetical protein